MKWKERAEVQIYASSDFIWAPHYLFTYSMEQNPSWEAIRFSVSQEIPRIL
jgi:hypothetical protein